jgi:hypothetical protein
MDCRCIFLSKSAGCEFTTIGHPKCWGIVVILVRGAAKEWIGAVNLLKNWICPYKPESRFSCGSECRGRELDVGGLFAA